MEKMSYLAMKPNYGIEIIIKPINLTIELRRINWVKLMGFDGGYTILDSTFTPKYFIQGSLINEHHEHNITSIKYRYSELKSHTLKIGAGYNFIKKVKFDLDYYKNNVKYNYTEHHHAISLLHAITFGKFDFETRIDYYLNSTHPLNWSRVSLGLIYRMGEN